MTDFKNTVYWQIYSDVFALHKKYAEVREDDKYWQQLVNEADDLFMRYEKIPEKEFARQLVLTVINELEQVYKKKKENENEKKVL